jgi:MoaA/NifB/PqqE/SkfB family radical SAM enzyme
MRQYFQLLRILLDRRVTAVPRRVLAQLSRQGKRRLPDEVGKSLGRRLPGLKGLAFMRQWLEGEQLTFHNGQWVINSFLPPFPGPAFDRMFENLLSGRRLSPVSAFLAVSDACPYHCWHCSYKNRAPGNLDTAQWLKIIDTLHRLGASIIGFTGGEPCSRPDLPQLVSAASAGGAATILFSSGACLDLPLMKDLKQAGLWSICLSLDHPSAAEHDRLRGAPGAHATACHAMRLARNNGFYTMAGVVVTRALVQEGLLRPIHKLAQECGAHELRLVEPMPCGLLAQGGEDSMLEPEHIAAIRRFHLEANRKRLRPKVCAFNQIESPELFGCGAGTQHLFVDAKGEVCPCDFTAMSFGNAAHEPLDVIWTRMSDAMGNPRRHCFVHAHYRLLLKHSHGQFPMPPEKSCLVCAEAGREALPDYFQLITGRKEQI